jgi:hypothetical protein
MVGARGVTRATLYGRSGSSGGVGRALGRGALFETPRELAFSVPQPRRTAAAT